MATLIVPADVRKISPLFDSLTDPQIQAKIDLADLEINPTAWGARAKYAEALLTAHLLVALGALNASAIPGAGPVQSVSVGDVSVTYATAGQASKPSALATSVFGQEYNRLIDLQLMGLGVIS